MLGEIIGSVATKCLKFVVEYLTLWYEREKAQANEINAATYRQQLKSVKAADVQAVKVNAPEQAEPIRTVSDWNLGAAIILLVLTMLAQGCIVRTVYVSQKLITLDPPARPILNGPEQLTARESLLATYARELENLIARYNDHAIAENTRNGY